MESYRSKVSLKKFPPFNEHKRNWAKSQQWIFTWVVVIWLEWNPLLNVNLLELLKEEQPVKMALDL